MTAPEKLPRVVVYVGVSLDARVTGFEPAVGAFYGRIAAWNEDLTLAGGDTILAAPEGRRREPAGPVARTSRGRKPLLAVVDSRGRVRCWEFLRNSGYWRGVVALGSQATPKRHFAYLRRRNVELISTPGRKVNLKAALQTLVQRHRIRVVRVESGSKLNSALLRAGLVHEVSLLVHPKLVGSARRHPFCLLPAGFRPPIDLKLVGVKRLPGDLLWLRYRAFKPVAAR